MKKPKKTKKVDLATIPLNTEASTLPPMPNNIPDKIPPMEFGELDPEVQGYLKGVLNEQIKQEIEHDKKVKKKKVEGEVVKNILTEYMQSFALIGYDVYGNRVNLKYARTERDNDALLEQLRYIIFSILNNQ